MNANFLKQWIKEAQEDPSLQYIAPTTSSSTTTLEQANGEQNLFLDGKTAADLSDEIQSLLEYVGAPQYLSKLQYYQYIDSISALRHGRIIRCLPKVATPFQGVDLPKVATPFQGVDLPKVASSATLREKAGAQESLPKVASSPRSTPQLQLPGMVADIKFMADGIHVIIRLFNHRHVQYRFDDYYFFQKLTADEMLILSALEDGDGEEEP